MRAVVLLCGAVLLVDTVFYAVLSPLLAGYADTAGLDRSGVGLLVAAYPLGMAVGSIPAGVLASRRGPRAVLVTGALITAASCLLFATASSGSALVAFRFVQGVGGALSWTAALVWVASVAPPDRRGEVIGRLLALSVIGGMLGPAVGALGHGAGHAARLRRHRGRCAWRSRSSRCADPGRCWPSAPGGTRRSACSPTAACGWACGSPRPRASASAS